MRDRWRFRRDRQQLLRRRPRDPLEHYVRQVAAMSAEPIAAVVADMRARRVQRVPVELGMPGGGKVFDLARDLIVDPVVVDATAVYQGMLARDRPIALYEDHPSIAPPWDEAAICYVNEHGNVVVMHCNVVPFDPDAPPWEAAEPVDWHNVRWRIDVMFWIGGRSTHAGALPVTGPMHISQLAVYSDASPADIHWVQLMPDTPLDHWDMKVLVLLGTLNFLACRNVELVEPVRPRPERRRLERLGVTVKTLNVFPVNQATRSAKGPGSVGTPLTPVRGHFAHYGPEYGRRKLFGKLSGKFWIPQHIRGDADFGEIRNDYRVADPAASAGRSDTVADAKPE